MGDSIAMTENELGARLRSDATGAPKAVFRAMISAAQRGKSWMVKNSPVDRGILRNAWKIIKTMVFMQVELVNDQPYAGVVEAGARPFKISGEGVWALKGWVMRKLRAGQMFPQGAQTRIAWAKGWNKSLRTAKGQSLIISARKRRFKKPQLEMEAERIAWAIAKTFEKLGMKGKRFVMQNLPQLAALMEDEINRSLSNFFNRPMRSQ